MPTNISALQDGMKTQWDPAHVRDVVAAHMAGRDVDAIITFDADGISSVSYTHLTLPTNREV